MYTSTKQIYKKLSIENEWTITQIDEMDAHFYFEVLEVEDYEPKETQQEKVYLSDVW